MYFALPAALGTLHGVNLVVLVDLFVFVLLKIEKVDETSVVNG